MTKIPVVTVGIIIISDRAFKKKYPDLSIPKIKKFLSTHIRNPLRIHEEIIKDCQGLIESRLKTLCDQQQCAFVLTSGGTGPSRRDVTPEATVRVCEKLLPGMSEVMRQASFDQVATAMLSRQISGVRKKTLIINLPGNPKAIATCLNAIFPAIPDCLDLIGAANIITTKKVKVYRHKQ